MAGYLSKEAKLEMPEISPELKQRLINTAISSAVGGGGGALYDLATKGSVGLTSPLVGAGTGALGYNAYDALKNYKGSSDYDSYLDFLKGNRVSGLEKFMRGAKDLGGKALDAVKDAGSAAGDKIMGMEQAIADQIAPLYLRPDGSYDEEGFSKAMKTIAANNAQAVKGAWNGTQKELADTLTPLFEEGPGTLRGSMSDAAKALSDRIGAGATVGYNPGGTGDILPGLAEVSDKAAKALSDRIDAGATVGYKPGPVSGKGVNKVTQAIIDAAAKAGAAPKPPWPIQQ